MSAAAALLLLALAAPELPPLPADAVRLILVRHGEAYTNLSSPPPDMPEHQRDRLTERGRAMVQALTKMVAPLEPHAILASPAGRAFETAAILSRELPTAFPTGEPRLRPIEMGRDAAGKELAIAARVEDWRAGRDPRPRDGESIEDVGARVDALARDMASRHRGQVILLVAHSEVIGAWLGSLAAVEPAKRYPFNVGLASMTVVDVPARGPARILVTAVEAAPATLH